MTDTASPHAEERAEQLERHKQQHVELDAELDSDLTREIEPMPISTAGARAWPGRASRPRKRKPSGGADRGFINHLWDVYSVTPSTGLQAPPRHWPGSLPADSNT